MPDAVSQRTAFFNVWRDFIDSSETKGIPHHILQSWLRCKKLGLDPFNDISPQTGDHQLIKSRLKKNADLHQLIQYHCEKINKETDLSHYNITFSDPDGYILAIEGHDKILQISENSTIEIGSNLSECSVGTTAPGVSLVEKRPVLIHAEEHFSTMFHWATCMAVPIFNHKNKITGCLNISTTVDNQHKLEQMSMYFYNMATSFQFEHFIKKKFQELNLYTSFFDSTFKYADKNLILISNNLDIINLNAKAKNCLGVGPFELYNRNILESLNINAAKFRSILDAKGIDTFNLSAKGEIKDFSIHVMPIYDQAGNETSYLLELTPETKKVAVPRKSFQEARFTFQDIIGTSLPLVNVIARAKKTARTGSNVLIEGETGTGKELFAHAIHKESPFAQGPFVAINCSAIPAELVESELFGYEKGAYTGAQKSGSMGKFEMADNGTIFLDEIHTMNLSAQMKILRTVEDRTVQRVGGKIPIPLTLRIIAATSENIGQEVESGRFLNALFFRLNVVRLQIPTLEARKDDIPILVEYFIRDMNTKFNCSIKGIDEQALNDLMQYSYPGNVRELKNIIEGAFNFCEGTMIDRNSLNLPTMDHISAGSDQTHNKTLDGVTCQLICENLKRFGTVKDAAEFLNIPVSTFYRKMKKFGISKKNV